MRQTVAADEVAGLVAVVPSATLTRKRVDSDGDSRVAQRLNEAHRVALHNGHARHRPRRSGPAPRHVGLVAKLEAPRTHVPAGPRGLVPLRHVDVHRVATPFVALGIGVRGATGGRAGFAWGAQVSHELQVIPIGRRGCAGGARDRPAGAGGREDEMLLEERRWSGGGEAGEDLEDVPLEGGGDLGEEEQLMHGDDDGLSV